MEKQRAGLPYKTIISNFYKSGINGYFTGIFPMGIASGFVKGCSIGLPYSYLQKNLQMANETNKKIIIGLSTGITESIFLNPILIYRNSANKITQNSLYINIFDQFTQTKLVVKNNLLTDKLYFFKGINLLICKRSIDWILRFYFIGKVEEKYKYLLNKDKLTIKDKILTTFIGASITMPFSTPFDRFLPLIYEKNYQEIKNIFKSNNIKLLYTGGVARFLNIGLYTTITLNTAEYFYNKY